MKAVALVLAFLLSLMVLSHPAAVAAVLSAELAVCGVLAWLTYRGLRAAMIPATWRRTT
jgi:hypothetical protein